MLRLTKCLVLVLVAFSATFVFAGSYTVLCTESSSGATNGDSAGGLQQGGCVNSLPNLNFPYTAASDGEVYFDPYNAGYDTSDGIKLNSSWLANNSNGAFSPGFWTNKDVNGNLLNGGFTWVLPASTPCGQENEPACEPKAYFYATGMLWDKSVIGQYVMKEDQCPPGWSCISDIITLDNNGPNGWAEISFDSIPEPNSLALMVVPGVIGLAGFVRRRFKLAR